MHRTEEFAERIGPAVLGRAGDVERTGRGEREQVMRVERQLVFLLGEGLEARGEPMRETAALVMSADHADGLAEDALVERGAAATGVIGDDEGETLVLRTRPERSLAETRMAVHRSAPGVDRIVMLLCGEENLREVTLFPMNQKAEDLMMNAPAPVSDTRRLSRSSSCAPTVFSSFWI